MCYSIYTGKDIIEIVNMMNGVVLVHSVLRRREDAGVVVGSVRIVKGNSITVRRR